MQVVKLYSSGRLPIAEIEIAQVDPPWELVIWRGRVFKWMEHERKYLESTAYKADSREVPSGGPIQRSE